MGKTSISPILDEPVASIDSQAVKDNSDLVQTVCETAGFAAAVIWLPFLLISCVLADTKFVLFGFQFERFWMAMCAVGICLACIAVSGFILAACATHLRSAKQLHAIWAGGAICAILSFATYEFAVHVIPLAISYSIGIIFWRVHIANKTFHARAMIAANLVAAMLMITCSILTATAAQFIPFILLVATYCLFIPSLPHILSNWKQKPIKAMVKGSDLAFRFLYHFLARVVAGIAYAALCFTYSPRSAVLFAGGSFLIAYLYINLHQRLDNPLPLRTFRIGEAILVLILLLILGIVPESAIGVPAMLCLACVTADHLQYVIIHADDKKDDELSDFFYFSLRHGFNTIGVMLGYFGMVLLAEYFEIQGVYELVFMGLAGTFFVIAALAQQRAFKESDPVLAKEAPNDTKTVTVYVDTWREKVLKVAQEHELTPRQTDIFDALSRGRNAKYIMERLYLSEGTVKKQSHQIYKKLGVHNQQDLITMVLETKLDSDEDDSRPDLHEQWRLQEAARVDEPEDE